MRNMIFISHASPEDNEFTRWLALRLAREGYAVWCDLTKLLGGETFWEDIEEAIRHRTVKFLFVLSRTSNTKKGPLDELSLALDVARETQLHDFVIPLHIDDLPHREMYVQIRRLNAIEFAAAWADGLRMLMRKIAEDKTSKDERFSAGAVAAWWKTNLDGRDMIRDESEQYYSNWFPIPRMPAVLYCHTTKRNPVADQNGIFPHHRVGDCLFSFAPAADLGLTEAETIQTDLDYALNHELRDLPLSQDQRRDAVTQLLRQSWDRLYGAHAVPTYTFSNGRLAGFFTAEALGQSRVSFKLSDGFSGSRSLAGAARGRHWHFAISARPKLWSEPHYLLKTHVLFSDDGKTIWASKSRLHSIRRTHCRDLWNDVWRDRLLAAMSWFAGGHDEIDIPVSSSASVGVSCRPFCLTSPVSYDDTLARRSDVWKGDFDYDETMDDECAEASLEADDRG